MVIRAGYFVMEDTFDSRQKSIMRCEWDDDEDPEEKRICRPWNCSVVEITGISENSSTVKCDPIEGSPCLEGYQGRLCSQCNCTRGTTQKL